MPIKRSSKDGTSLQEHNVDPDTDESPDQEDADEDEGVLDTEANANPQTIWSSAKFDSNSARTQNVFLPARNSTAMRSHRNDRHDATTASAPPSAGQLAQVPFADSPSTSHHQTIQVRTSTNTEHLLNSSQQSQYTPVINNYHLQQDNRQYHIQQVQNIENNTAPLKARIESLEESLEHERRQRTDRDYWKSRCTDLQATIDQRDETIRQWQAWHQGQKATNENLKKIKDDADKEIERLKEKARQNSARHKEDMASRRKKYNDLNDEHSAMKNELNQANKNIGGWRDHYHRLTADVSARDATIVALEKTCSRLRTERNNAIIQAQKSLESQTRIGTLEERLWQFVGNEWMACFDDVDLVF